MRKYNVNITEDAFADMKDIYNYISHELQAPENAKGQYNRIANAIVSLENLPERFPLFDIEPEQSMGIRKMVVDNYLVCYLVDHENVTVIAIFYGASDVHFRLSERNR